ncbi:hypothetical protein CPC08DRAFT_332997 [Agrocybe pediades]|nr:hypothetical protein CPC08DRAFT_332997 [Agrocybe pediades]
MKHMEEPFTLPESNSISCGGFFISNVIRRSPVLFYKIFIFLQFAMSSWVANGRLKAASLNCSAVFTHTHEQSITYNDFNLPSPGRSLESDWRMGLPY